MLTTPPVTDVASHLRLVVARTARRLRQEAGQDLSPSLTSALASIDRHGPLTPSELAAHERVQRPTAPADRRSALISASPAGRALLRRLRTRKNHYLAERLAVLEPDELATLDRAAVILERMLDEEERR